MISSSKTILAMAISSVLLAGCGGGGDSTPTPTPTPTPAATDPLLIHQWYITNTGQANFASTPGIAGEDVKVAAVHAQNITGSGIKVAVTDSGLDIHHADLVANVMSGRSWDFVNNDNDPTPAAGTGFDHGTSVSGIIAMKGWNNIGGRGVAPNASLAGFNWLESQSDISFIDSHGGSKTSDFDLFNQSWGGTSIVSAASYETDVKISQYRASSSGMSAIRGGKGAIFIKSAGNGFDIGSCGQSPSTNSVSCENASLDISNIVPEVMVIAALNAEGKKSSYSTAGSANWVSGLGGEYGYNASRVPGIPDYAYKPTLMTTDVSSCSAGGVVTNAASPRNDFETGSHPENVNCDYTSAMNGTSAAAPVTSGVVALMLEANPNLTWRDVKHILATTANQVDATIAPVTYTVGGQSLIAEPAWTTNAAGYKFHNWYGFGRINAEAAVAMAKTYTSYLPATGQLNTGWKSGLLTTPTTIPDNDVTGLSDTVNVASSGITQIEAVQVELGGLTIDEYTDLNIEIVSPNGTRSVIMPAYNGYNGYVTSLTYVLASNAFYGEPADGNWTVKVVDARAGNTGTLTTTKLRIFGR